MNNLVPASGDLRLGVLRSEPDPGFELAGGSPHQQFGFTEFLRVIARHRNFLLVVIGLTTLAVLVWQLTSPTLYRSTANIKVELIDDVGTNQAEVQARNVQRIANEVKLYRSRATAERVARDLKAWEFPAVIKAAAISESDSDERKLAMATTALMRMVEVEAEEGSDLVGVSVTARSPKFAALAANQFPLAVQSLKEAREMARRQELLKTLLVEQEQRAGLASNSAKRLVNFRLENQMLEGAGSAEDLQQINRIATEAASLAGMRAGSAAQSAGVARAAGMRSTADATTAALQSLERQEAELAAEQARLSQTFGSRHPDMLRITGQLDEVRVNKAREQSRAASIAAQVAGAEAARMTQLAQAEASGTSARAGQLEGIVGGLVSRARNNLVNSVQLDQLEREANQAAKAFNDVAERIDQVRSAMTVEGVASTILSPAVANDNAIAPAPLKMTLLAFLSSGLLGLMLVYAREILDDKLRTVAQVRRLFGLPTFGMLPMLSGGISPRLQESPVVSDPQSLFAEVARSTLVEVNSLRDGDKAQSVLITSPLPGDGKSVVTLTLAAAAMMMGKRVAVLDLDLRKASILQQLQRDLELPGLLEVLRGHVDVKQLIAPRDENPSLPAAWEENTEVDLSRFTLLSATRPIAEPAALLNSGRLELLIDDLKARFDMVIINAPATLAVRDARTLCEFTDETVVVARWGKTTIDQMRATLELLGPQRVSGVVFDQVDYAEHARRRYGDSIEFYCESSSYYTDPVPVRWSMLSRLNRRFSPFAKAA